MNKAAILDELPNLSVEDREEIFAILLHMNDSVAPTKLEQHILNEVQADYQSDGKYGEDWATVERRLRKRS